MAEACVGSGSETAPTKLGTATRVTCHHSATAAAACRKMRALSSPDTKIFCLIANTNAPLRKRRHGEAAAGASSGRAPATVDGHRAGAVGNGMADACTLARCRTERGDAHELVAFVFGNDDVSGGRMRQQQRMQNEQKRSRACRLTTSVGE